MGENNIDILFIRVDRIGDLVLSLPVDQAPGISHLKTHWLISRGLGFVLDHADPKRQYTEMDREFSWKNLLALISWLKKNRPQAAINFYSPWWVNFALWWARVPLRIGRYSLWHSFLFLNRGLRQKRSRAEKHEMEYNFDLINLFHKPAPELKFYGALKLVGNKTAETLAELGLAARNYFVVHPGMGGSALNWPTSSYRELITQLASQSPVVITGTEADEKYILPLYETLKNNPQVIWLNKKLSTGQLISVLESATAVVAPSTGVVHLAASTATPTVGLYSPITTERSIRWGPKGPNVSILDATTGGDDPMSSITVKDVLNSLKQLGVNVEN